MSEFVGWLVNTSVLRQGKKTIVLFVLYTIACCSCYILSIMTINPVVDSNPYQTFANYFSLLFRCFVMLLFVFELKETTQQERNLPQLQFFHHFGACCMVNTHLSLSFFLISRLSLGLVHLSHCINLHHVLRHRIISSQTDNQCSYIGEFS